MDGYVAREPIDRELRRRQLAQRLVAHHARTQTVFHLTGLSRHQLATLRQRWQVTAEMRHRGPLPASFAAFLSTHRGRDEAAALAVLWKVFASVAAANGGTLHIGTVEMGECVCDVFEAYLACFPEGAFELDHLVLLARGIDEAQAVGLSQCTSCEAAMLADLLGTRRRVCSHCQRAVTATTMADESPANPEGIDPLTRTGEAVQQELF